MRIYNFICGKDAPMETEKYCDGCGNLDCERLIPPTRWEGITPDGKNVVGINVCINAGNDITDLRLFVDDIETTPREFRAEYRIPK